LATIRCPGCGTENAAPEAIAPFFCKKCHAVIDPGGALKAPVTKPRGADDPLPSSPLRGASTAPYASPTPPRYGAPAPAPAPSTTGSRPPVGTTYVAGPGAGFSVGGSRAIGYPMALLAGVVAAAALAWVAGSYLRVPIVYPLLVGWGIRRALAAGAGGGTPDRGVGGVAFMLLVVAAAFVAGKFVEYRVAAHRGNAQMKEIYGVWNPGMDWKDTVASMRARDPDTDGWLQLKDGTDVSIDAEQQRLQAAAAVPGLAPSEPYDVVLLASSGQKGFTGWAKHVTSQGETLRLLPSQKGWALPGFAVILLAAVEFLVLAFSSFARIE
jgi:hypothetical protein